MTDDYSILKWRDRLFRDRKHLIYYVRNTIEGFVACPALVVPEIPARGKTSKYVGIALLRIKLDLVKRDEEQDLQRNVREEVLPLSRQAVEKGMPGPVITFRHRAFQTQEHFIAYLNDRVFRIIAPPVTQESTGAAFEITAKFAVAFGRRSKWRRIDLDKSWPIGGEKVPLIGSPEIYSGDNLFDLLH